MNFNYVVYADSYNFNKDDMISLNATKLNDFLYNDSSNTNKIYNCSQGMAITDNYIVSYLAKTDNDAKTDTEYGALFVLDKNNPQANQRLFIKSSCTNNHKNYERFPFHHGNDMTYDSKRKMLFIIDWNTVHSISEEQIKSNWSKENLEGRLDYTDVGFDLLPYDINKTNLSNEAGYTSIAYDEVNDIYIFLNKYTAYIYKLEQSSGEENYYFKYIGDTSKTIHNISLQRHGLISQGITANNGKLYYVLYENGSDKTMPDIGTVKYNGVLERNSNAILCVDIVTGKEEKMFYISNDAINGEVESLDFDNNKMVISSNTNTWKNITHYIISKPSVKYIEIIDQPSKLTYLKKFEDLNTDNGKLKATYEDNTTGSIYFNKSMVSGFDKNKLGNQSVTVKYGGQVATYNVNVNEPTLTNIEISNIPTKKIYKTMEILNLTGGILKATYNNVYSEYIDMNNNKEIKYSGFDNSKIGKQTITITYKNKQTTFNVEIIENNKQLVNVSDTSKTNGYLQIVLGILFIVFGSYIFYRVYIKKK